MRRWKQLALVSSVLAVVGAACAPPQSANPGGSLGAAAPATKRVVAAIRGNPSFLISSMNSGGGGRIDGNTELNGLVSTALSVDNNQMQRIPLMAETIPSLENGQWRVLPDGKMVLDWKLREAYWHDGAPVTSADYVFTARLDQDREMPWLVDRAYRFIDSVEAPDPQTVRVVWNQVYIRAHKHGFSPLYAKHLLEEQYLRDKESLAHSSFWHRDWVGNGPFKVKDWVPDSHVVLTAFDRWVLGRPKIDELEVKFIPDDNALVANLLAGAVDFALGPGLSVEQGVQIRDRWTEGTMLVGPSGDIKMNVQFLDPDPPILLNPQFRKALYMAIDRQALVDELVFGLTHVLDASIGPFHEEYRFIEPYIVKYPYDPRRAGQMIEELGYRRGGDGMFVDASGRLLSIQIMATTDDSNAKPQQVILDMWKRIGITPELEAVTQQRQRDLAYRANFKAFSLQSGQSFGPDNLDALYSHEARTAEKNYLGKNYTRHMNPEIDDLVTRYYGAIAFNERMQLLGQLVRYTTDQLVWFMLYERVVPTMVNNRMVNVPSLNGDQWHNAHLWDTK